MEQGPLGLAPGLRTPTGRTCQRTPGEGRASSTRPELYARHNRTSFPHAHSQCATSCRTTGVDMSIATVKAHVSRLLEKLGFNNRVQIALLAHDAGEA